ncbi:MAG: hypothetical protein BWY74_01727 [Firmicutes bacterium ADurb.Bin419]|nr:MAG: hypothetical protein BWY74_01727 [Firmicutes bacterium ADurb.Bin419]
MKKIKLVLIFLFASLNLIYSPIDSNAEPINDIINPDNEIDSAIINDESILNNRQYSYSDPEMSLAGNANIDPKMLIPGNPDIDPKMLIELHPMEQVSDNPSNEHEEDPVVIKISTNTEFVK